MTLPNSWLNAQQAAMEGLDCAAKTMAL